MVSNSITLIIKHVQALFEISKYKSIKLGKATFEKPV